MHDIRIMGKVECEFFSEEELDKDYVVVSINDNGCDTTIHPNERIKGVLKLTFDDIEEDIEGCVLFNESMGIEIKDFIDRYKGEVNGIVVHCTAGISRSGAVGCVLARYLNGQDDYLWSSGSYMPNKLVYSVLCSVMGLYYSDGLFADKKALRRKSGGIKTGGSGKINLDDLFV